MKAAAKILVEGFTNALSVDTAGEEITQPTITLVKDGDIVMVVDPGILESQDVLVDALGNQGLSVNDVNVVCITHSHLDHYRNIGMFPEAKTLEFHGLWNKTGVEDWPEQFSENIRVARVPGHSRNSIALLVKTDEGIIAVCGDIFWSEDFPANPEDDIYAYDIEKLQESRKMILKSADFVIPGHGPMFKTDKKHIDELNHKIAKIKSEAEKFPVCKFCKRIIKKPEDKCLCRQWLCFRCCECELDCDLCSCSHKNK